MRKVVFVGLLIVLFAVLILPVSAAETSGTCGDNATWQFEESTGTLTISGTGAMSDSGWEDYKGSIKKIVITDGITSICEAAFSGCSQLKDVSIAQSVTELGVRMFENCTSLKSIVIPNGVSVIQECTFWDCVSLTSVILPETLTEIEEAAFRGCSALPTITFPKSLQSLGDAAFTGCSKLKHIYFKGGIPSVKNFTFSGVEATLYYPNDNEEWENGRLGYSSGGFTMRAYCAEGHDFGPWTVIQEATEEQEGKEERICDKCKQRERRNMPKLPPSTKPTEPPTEPPTAPPTEPPTEPVTQPPTEPPTTPATDPEPTEAPTAPEPAASERADTQVWIVWISAGVLILAGGAVAAWFFVIKRQK